jgi:mitofilin
MRRQLKLQSEVHTDHLREALSVKEQETRRALQNVFSEKVEAEFIKYETRLAAVVGRLHAFATSLKSKCLPRTLTACLPEPGEQFFRFSP